LKSTCKNSGTFEEKKISPEKVTYVSLAPSHSIRVRLPVVVLDIDDTKVDPRIFIFLTHASPKGWLSRVLQAPTHIASDLK